MLPAIHLNGMVVTQQMERRNDRCVGVAASGSGYSGGRRVIGGIIFAKCSMALVLMCAGGCSRVFVDSGVAVTRHLVCGAGCESSLVHVHA